MGPEFWKQDKETRLKKCSEHSLTCNEQDVIEGCCAVVACRYCVRWEPYEGSVVSDITDIGDGVWSATPGGIVFTMEWLRDDYTGDCELVVTFDGEEVYRSDCYSGVSCRDSSDSVEVDTGYLVGTLTWSKDLKRPLPRVRDEYTNCIRNVCPDCECTCECLCVSISQGYGCDTILGEICDTAYDCDLPVWAGIVGGYDIEVSLNDDCTLSATVDGYPYDVVLAPYTSVCDGIDATITLGDGVVITIQCRDCQCEVADDCVVGCCWPTVVTELYPCGYPVPVPFEISAPGCDLDGYTGEFTPAGSASGECGLCAASPPMYIGTTIGERKAPNVFFCMSTPCSVDVVLRLVCEDGSGTCCGGFRLWVGTSERFVGWDGTTPAGSDPSLYWMKFAPSSCACDPLAMIFDVTFVSDCPETWVGGTCDGKPKDCCDPTCGGFTLTI